MRGALKLLKISVFIAQKMRTKTLHTMLDWGASISLVINIVTFHIEHISITLG